MKIDHVGIAVQKLSPAIDLYRKRFGLVVTHEEELSDRNLRVAFLGDPASQGNCEIELLEPTGDGAVAKFIETRGPGMHHLAFHTDDVAGNMARLKEAGTPPMEAAPRPGARGHSVCFVHPRHAFGTLLELVGEGK